MKRAILIVLGIMLLGLLIFGLKLNSDLNEISEAFHFEHSLADPNIVLLRSQKAPNGTHEFYEYQFDNGGLGNSRVFWSVKTHESTSLNLEKGLLPDGYKIIDWTESNELLITKWTPYYSVDAEIELSDGDIINGVSLKLIK